MNDVLNHPTFTSQRTRPADLRGICLEADRHNKARFECYQSITGATCVLSRAFVACDPRVQNDLPTDQHYVIHSTTVHGARGIFIDGMKKATGRQEFHFVDAHFSDRQGQYVSDRRKPVWLMIDTVLASRLGISIRKLGSEVITTPGNRRGEIPPDCFAAAFRADGAKLKVAALMKDNPTMASGTQDNLLPTPRNRSLARDAIYVPIEGDSNSEAAPQPSPPLPPIPKSPTFRPRSPTAEQLAERSPERPPSWYPQGAAPLRNESCTRRGRSRTPHAGTGMIPPVPQTGYLSVPPLLPTPMPRPLVTAHPPGMPVPPVLCLATPSKFRIENLPVLKKPRQPKQPPNVATVDLAAQIEKAVESEVTRRLGMHSHGETLTPRIDSYPPGYPGTMSTAATGSPCSPKWWPY